jgi:hypothetical protein
MAPDDSHRVHTGIQGGDGKGGKSAGIIPARMRGDGRDGLPPLYSAKGLNELNNPPGVPGIPARRKAGFA